jgi:hypothetical protein
MARALLANGRSLGCVAKGAVDKNTQLALDKSNAFKVLK